jgi:hypothetical protein
MLADNTDSKRKRLIHSALLILVGIIVYANSLTVSFTLDDHYSIVHYGKQSITDLLLHGTARPVADLTFALNYHIHGTQVAGYHIVNLIIHLCTTLLLYTLVNLALSALRQTYGTCGVTSDDLSPLEQCAPLVVALLFVSHPAQTQAVTYIIQRYTSLATCLYLLTVVLFIRARLAYLANGRLPWLSGVSALMAGLLALGSKQIAATLPLMLLLLEVGLFRSRLLTRRFYLSCAAFLLVGIAITAFLIGRASSAGLLQRIQQATTDNTGLSRASYFLTELPVVARYLRLLFLPIGQSLTHDPPVFTSIYSRPVFASLALHIVLIVGSMVLFRRSEQNLGNGNPSGSYQRLASLGIFWFYCAMAVESSIIPIRDVMNEHRMYLPSAGFFLAVTAGFALVMQQLRLPLKTAAILSGLVCSVLGVTTVYRNHIWNDPVALWQEAAHSAPQHWLASANLANEYSIRNMPQQALPLYIRAIEQNPNLFFRAKIGLGKSLAQLKLYPFRHTTGEEYVSSGGVLDSGVIAQADVLKWDAVINNNLGLAYEYLQDLNSARLAYTSALASNPNYDLAWLNLALLAARQGNMQQTETARTRLNTLNPPMAHELDGILKSTFLK